MGCVLGQKDKLDSNLEYIIDIQNSKEAIALSEESLYSIFKTNFALNLHVELTDYTFGYIKESLLNIYKNIDYKTNSKENYSIKMDFMGNPIFSEVSYRMLREIIYFVHFTSKNFVRKFHIEFKFKNCLIFYKADSLEESMYKYSIILLSDFQMGFVKDFCLKFQFENFLYFDKNEVKLSEIIQVMMKTLSDNEVFSSYRGIIFPPLEYKDHNELNLLLSEISNKFFNFVEIPMKIVQSNFQNLKSLIKTIQLHMTSIENFCLTLMFYNLKTENVSKITEMILNLLQEFLLSFFIDENTNKNFFVKLFFVLYETNTVEYKYYVFKEKTHQVKRGGLRKSTSTISPFAQSNPFNSLKFNVLKNLGISNEVLILGKKFKKEINQKKKILKLIESFLNLNEVITSCTTRDSYSVNFKKNSLPQSGNNSSFESMRSSRSSLTGLNYPFLYENQKRKFVIEDKDSDNFNLDYNEKFIEFYKVS
jgi:hypothetical protein